MSYLHLKNLKVYNANAHAGYYLIGFPAMTGIVGFAYKLVMDINTIRNPLGENIKLKGISPLVSRMQILDAHPKYVNYQHNSLTKGDTAAILDRRGVHLWLDLILEITVSEPDKELDFSAEENEEDEGFEAFLQGKSFENLFFRRKFCSGNLSRITSTQQFSVVDKQHKNEENISAHQSDWLDFHDSVSSLRGSLEKLPSYYFIIEDGRSRFAEALQNELDRPSLDILFDFIRRYPRNYEFIEFGPHPPEDRRSYLPLAVGYQGLEPPTERGCSRGGYPHLFAEPVIGLGVARSLGSYRKHSQEEDIPIFWNFHHDLENGLYLTQAHP